jgi:hypothetical protein
VARVDPLTRSVKLTPEHAAAAVEEVVPPRGVPEQATGGTNRYMVPFPGHTVLVLFAVAVLDAAVEVVIEMKLVAVVPLIPTEALVILLPAP